VVKSEKPFPIEVYSILLLGRLLFGCQMTTLNDWFLWDGTISYVLDLCFPSFSGP
jgi:hypothetical protein